MTTLGYFQDRRGLLRRDGSDGQTQDSFGRRFTLVNMGDTNFKSTSQCGAHLDGLLSQLTGNFPLPALRANVVRPKSLPAI